MEPSDSLTYHVKEEIDVRSLVDEEPHRVSVNRDLNEKDQIKIYN